MRYPSCWDSQTNIAGEEKGSTPERWQSGRMYLTRNQAYVQTYRGFESHPLRQGPNVYAGLEGVKRKIGPDMGLLLFVLQIAVKT